MDINHIKQAEKKTFLVIVLTLVTMIAEIAVGYFTHSMALFADGCHMGTHALALSLTFFTYILITRFATSDRFAFGTGKFSTLSGFASSILLGLTGIFIIFESIERLFHPEQIGFNEAILVAIIGLVVNALSILIMGDNHDHNHAHKHSHGHETHEHNIEFHKKEHKEDFNFKAAYMHILADALTSIFAIVALLAGKYFNWIFLDPVVGFIGGTVICIWAYNLIKSTTAILVDCENKDTKAKITETIKNDCSIEELHVWAASEDNVNVIAKVAITNTECTADDIKHKIAETAAINSITVEITSKVCPEVH